MVDRISKDIGWHRITQNICYGLNALVLRGIAGRQGDVSFVLFK